MVKCPRGTPDQIKKNLSYLESLRGRTVTNAGIEDVYKSESEEFFGPEEGCYTSIPEFDVIRADKRNPPTTEDEITYLFINHFLDILLKCWDGTPCLKPKLANLEEIPKSEVGEMSERENILDDKQGFDLTEEYLNNLYKTKSQKLLKETKQERMSVEDTLSIICREQCESWTSGEQEINEDEEGSTLSWKVVIPDEDVYMSFQNGAWYKGRVSRRLMDGDGTFFWGDGTSFQGEFISGAVTGSGRLEFPDLSVYEGGVYKGFRHGEGLLCIHDSPIMYSGEWWLGKKSGQGIMFYNDPKDGLNYYYGSWVDGKQEGFGCRQYQSGAKYLGNWKNGKRDGTGIMFWCNKDIYRGEWKDGLMNGFGEYMWKGFVNKTFTCARVNAYRGYWKDGKKNGVGILEMSNGSMVETIWVNDEKNGPGVVICPNGTVILSNQKLFTNDKPALLNEQEENLLGELFRTHAFQTNRRKNAKKDTPKLPDRDQLLAYMSSMEKAKVFSIPIHTPIHALDLSCHTGRLKEQKSKILKKKKAQINILGLNNTPRIESFSDRENPDPQDVNQSEETLSSTLPFEEKLLRYSVMVNLSRLKGCYEQWSSIACSVKPHFQCNLLRLFFWELLTVSNVPMKNFSLIDVDNLLADEPAFLIDLPHDPFEKIQFWQFIHFLISLSWHIYGRYIYSENASLASEEVQDFLKEFYNQKEKAALSLAFNYFLQKHIYAEHETDNVVKNWDLVPMGAMYRAYKSVGEPHSAKDFLIDLNRKKEETYLRKTNIPLGIQDFVQVGNNAIPITSEVSYLMHHDTFNQPEISTAYYERGKMSNKREETCFTNLEAEDIVQCLTQACPNIMEEDLIVDMEYQMTFLEYYKAIILCAAVSLKKKSLQQMHSEILSNYKKELEEYNRKMKEYESQREAALQLTKKASQIRKSKK